MFLLDTELLVDLRRGTAGGAPAGLLAWAGAGGRQRLFVSAQSLLELERGASAARRRSPAAGAVWRHWLDEQLVPAFEGRILPIDAAVARRQAELPYPEPRDALLAATSLVHGLTLATYQPRHFRAGKIKTFDPRSYSADLDNDWRSATQAGSLWLKNLFVRG